MSDHKADAEALARVQAYLAAVEGARPYIDAIHTPENGRKLRESDLRRVVNLADRTADAR